MSREEVYKAIDSERDYQDKMSASSDRPDMIEDLHIGDTITAIQRNLNQATETWYLGAVPHDEALKHFRKIAALCVKAGERYGMQLKESTPLSVEERSKVAVEMGIMEGLPHAYTDGSSSTVYVVKRALRTPELAHMNTRQILDYYNVPRFK